MSASIFVILICDTSGRCRPCCLADIRTIYIPAAACLPSAFVPSHISSPMPGFIRDLSTCSRHTMRPRMPAVVVLIRQTCNIPTGNNHPLSQRHMPPERPQRALAGKRCERLSTVIVYSRRRKVRYYFVNGFPPKYNCRLDVKAMRRECSQRRRVLPV